MVEGKLDTVNQQKRRVIIAAYFKNLFFVQRKKREREKGGMLRNTDRARRDTYKSDKKVRKSKKQLNSPLHFPFDSFEDFEKHMEKIWTLSE